MNTGSWQRWTGLAILVLGASSPAMAQDRLPPAKNDAAQFPPMRASLDAKPTLPDYGDPANNTLIAPAPSTAPDHVTAPEEHAACEDNGLFVGADYLLMRARRRALDFAISDPNTSGVPQGTIESLNWKTDSGVRLNTGYRLSSGWELGTAFTYFRSGDDKTFVKPDGGTLFATLTHPGFVAQVDTAAASSNLEYYVFDADLGHRVRVSEDCNLRFFAGGRFAWVDQDFTVLYDGGDAHNAMVHSPVSFNGAGLRAGGEGAWKIGNGFSVFGRASGSLLIGYFRNRLTETNDAGATINTDVSDKFQQVVPVIEMGIGLAWEYRNIRASFGYEMTDWLNMVDSPDFTDDVHQGKLGHRTSDLSLDGLFFQLGVGY